IPLAPQDFPSHSGKGGTKPFITRHEAGPNQGLVLPNPGLSALVITIGLQTADQQPRGPTGTQASIDFVEFSGRSQSLQHVDQSLPQTAIKDNGIQGFFTFGGGIARL